MAEIMEMLKTEEVVDILCGLVKEKNAVDEKLKIYQTEMQRRGLKAVEDKNLKYKEFYGTGSNKAELTYSQSLEIINYPEILKIGEVVVSDNIKRVPEYKYTVKPKFAEVLKAIFNGVYTDELTVSEIVDKCFDFDYQQKELFLKKVKGNYKKDKELLLSVLGGKGGKQDFDVELDYILRAKNYEKIKMFFPNNTKEVIENIKKYYIVEDTPKIGVKFEDSDKV